MDDDAKWLEWVTKQFENIAGEDKEIDLEEFKTALKVKEASINSRTKRVFHIRWYFMPQSSQRVGVKLE